MTKTKLAQWDRDGTNVFIKLLRNHECLWNTKHANHNNRSKRKTSVNGICDALLRTGRHYSSLDITKKIKSLRTMYAREQKKVDASINSGVNADEVYTPCWEYFKALSFIPLNGVKCEDQSDMDEVVIKDVVTLDENHGQTFEVICSEPSSIDDGNTSSCTDISISQPTKKRKWDKSDVHEVMKAIAGVYPPQNEEQPQDIGVRGFLQFIGAQLMELPVKSRNKIQRKLLAFFLTEMEKLDDETNEYQQTVEPIIPSS